ncbi:hypothetical protein KC343_g2806 [Hortaea werneckii]|nr:hypothetical protein KC352_g9012 [Hortaea werneckii]KAI7569227.1 hypothetical protein KC317_g3507 [Hortaea werneckii]KAI7622858.1 hypothetical protein KC346_g3009 [Hortaea werneckii]KAI7633668.1 hypothetical protein KC343_g2806 [Hortaea werneckii]KAI7680298.1 hypothetical protein KC319_g2250 [Hortaea werneckii]
MAEEPLSGLDPLTDFLYGDPRFTKIEMMSPLEGSTGSINEAGDEQSDLDNDGSKSTGSITETGDEQSDNEEFTSVNTGAMSAQQGRVPRSNTGKYLADNRSRGTGSIDGAGKEQDGIGEGDAANSVGASQPRPIVITSARWPPSDPSFFFYTHQCQKDLLYGCLKAYKNKGLAHLFPANHTVAIILYHSAGPRSMQDILCEVIQMSTHYVTQLFTQGKYIAAKNFGDCMRLFDWDITITHDGNSQPLISLPDSVASILLTDIHRALLLPPGNRFEPKDEFSNKFLELPPELRNRIYNMVFSLPGSGLKLCGNYRLAEPRYFSMLTRSLKEEKPLDSWSSFSPIGLPDSITPIRSFPTSVLLSLLLVDKQVYLEAVGLFYYNNHFYCTDFADLRSFVKAIYSPKPLFGIDRLQFIKHVSFNFNFKYRMEAAEALTAVFEKFYNLQEVGVYIDEERWEVMKKKNMTPFYPSPEKYPGIDAFYNLIKMPSLKKLYVQGKCEKLKTLLLNPPQALKVNKRQRVKKGKEAGGQKEGVSENTDKSNGKGKGKKGKKKDEDKWVPDKRGPWPPANEKFELKIQVEGKALETFKPNGEGGFRKEE